MSSCPFCGGDQAVYNIEQHRNQVERERDEARAEVERLTDALVDVTRVDFRAGYEDAYHEARGIANKALAAG